VIQFDAIIINRCIISDLAKRQKQFHSTAFPDRLGYFYYEVTISRNGKEKNGDSFFHLDVGFSNKKDSNSFDYFCKLLFITLPKFLAITYSKSVKHTN